jgi:hypothetical protein
MGPNWGTPQLGYLILIEINCACRILHPQGSVRFMKGRRQIAIRLRKSSLPGIQEKVCSDRDPCPQQSASSDPPQIARES